MRKCSTSEAAKRLGMHRENLQRVIAKGNIPAPRLVKVGGIKVRLWTAQDIQRARRALNKSKT